MDEKNAAAHSKVGDTPQMNAENVDDIDDAEDVSVYTTVIKLAKFYQHAPEFWFAQIESQFRVKGISVDETMFYYAVAALPQEVALQVMPAVKSKSYITLKMALLAAFDLTETPRAASLLHLQGLGDKLPSVLASEIR